MTKYIPHIILILAIAFIVTISKNINDLLFFSNVFLLGAILYFVWGEK